MVDSYDPTITRLFSVPSNSTFAEFHEVLQTAFGWASGHLYSFSVSLFGGSARFSVYGETSVYYMI